MTSLFSARRVLAILLLAALGVGTAAAQDATECADGFRLFDHYMLANGAVCIPENPQRIAFIDDLISYGIALDVDSVTSNYYFRAILNDFPALLDEESIAAMTDVGDTWEMNPEALLGARPDLIVTSTWWEETNQFAQDIAPTVIFDRDRTESWLETFDAVAQLTGKEAEMALLLKGIDERIAVLRETLGDEAGETTFTVSIIETPEQLWGFTALNFGAELTLQAGLHFPDSIPTLEEAATLPDGAYAFPVSLELLPKLDADHVFLFTNFDDDVQDELFASPLWRAFEGSNPDRIHFLSGDYWVRDHPVAAHRIIDDLFRTIAGVEPDDVSPNPFAYTYAVEKDTVEE